MPETTRERGQCLGLLGPWGGLLSLWAGEGEEGGPLIGAAPAKVTTVDIPVPQVRKASVIIIVIVTLHNNESFNKQLLRTFCDPGIVQRAGDSMVHKTDRVSTFMEVIFTWGDKPGSNNQQKL